MDVIFNAVLFNLSPYLWSNQLSCECTIVLCSSVKGYKTDTVKGISTCYSNPIRLDTL